MFKYLLTVIVIISTFASQAAIAAPINQATPVNQATPDIAGDVSIQPVLPPTTAPFNHTNVYFLPQSENELWVKKNLGNDFYQFYTQKIKKKALKKPLLKLDYYLNLGAIKAKKFNLPANKDSAAENMQLKTLAVPKMHFADNEYECNPANISIVEMGDDYTAFINDEVSAGKTYKEFWDGEETTQLDGFIDEHFSFHDSALIRVLIMLVIILGTCLITVLGYKKYTQPD